MAPSKKWEPKPAVEKLPLAIRKELRDDWESVKADYEKKISDLMGKEYVINFNANEVYPYANSSWSSQTPGKMFVGYAEGLVSALENYMQEYEEDGKEHFNDAISKREFTVNVNEQGDQASTIFCDVKDGVFRILFRDDCLGYNQSSIGDYVVDAVDAVPRDGFPVVIKNSIKKYWEDEAESIRSSIAEIINMPDVKLDPNFEECYAALNAGKPSRDWKKQFGKVVVDYFNGLKSQLESQGFQGDEMLQEGLAEALTEKTFKLRVVKKLEKGSVNETFVRDGMVIMQTTDDNWYYNTSNMGDGLINQL